MAKKPSQGKESEIQALVVSFTPEEKMLIDIREELYDGDWEELLADLVARLEGKPYIFKLATQIEEDLVRIQKLRAFEAEHDINLRDHV